MHPHHHHHHPHHPPPPPPPPQPYSTGYSQGFQEGFAQGATIQAQNQFLYSQQPGFVQPGFGNQCFDQGGYGYNQQGGFGQSGFSQQGYGQGFGQNFNYGVADFCHFTQGNFDQNGASYAIQSAYGKCLDISQSNMHGSNKGDLIVYNYWGGKNQRFNISNDGPDLIIRSVQSGLVLQMVPGYEHGFLDQEKGKGRVRQMPYTGAPTQRWRIRRVGNNSNQCFIINVANGNVLDIEGNDNSNNASVITYRYTGGSNQIWNIIPAAPHVDQLQQYQNWW